MMLSRSSFRRFGVVALLIVGTFVLTSKTLSYGLRLSRLSSDAATWSSRNHIAKYLLRNPVQVQDFGEMGERVKLLTTWVEDDSYHHSRIPAIRDLWISMFPFLNIDPQNDLFQPFENIRKNVVPNSRGIVIPTGKNTFRFACHLIKNLRYVLKSKLPIQVVYAGDDDLPRELREVLVAIDSHIDTLDVTTVLNNKTLHLNGAGWAIKPFAMLASRFEKVILLDADAVFVQKPESIFDSHEGYKETGTLLFHDRLIDKGTFGPRHDFYNRIMKHKQPSKTLQKSRVIHEGYSQEADSGVVVLDKARIPVLMALLHTCWQNSMKVREFVTYRHTHGDKETYWIGLELTDVPYTFADHYGASLGYVNGSSVCGSSIAHVDERKKLLWFNGSLLQRKEFYMDQMRFADPKGWSLMLDGNWRWVTTNTSTGCMAGGETSELTPTQKDILDRSIEAARLLDEAYGHLMHWPRPERKKDAEDWEAIEINYEEFDRDD